MAAQLIRKPETDSVQMGAPGEEIRWTESFTYINTTPKNVWEVIEDALVPKQGERKTVGIYPNSTFTTSFVCQSVDVTPSTNSPNAWNVRVTWMSRRSKYYGQGTERVWFKITRSTQQRTAAMYRDDAAGSSIFAGVPADGTVAYPPTSWIAGTKVDTNAQPLQVKISQQLIQVDFLWDRTRNDSQDAIAGAALSPDPPSEWTSVYVNTRNNAAFLGWPTGYVTYLGWNANHNPDNWLVVSHRFLADDWQFLEQRPGPNVQQKPLLDTGPTWGAGANTVPTMSVKNVAWYQPFKPLENFQNLLNFDLHSGNLWQAITNPKPA